MQTHTNIIEIVRIANLDGHGEVAVSYRLADALALARDAGDLFPVVLDINEPESDATNVVVYNDCYACSVGRKGFYVGMPHTIASWFGRMEGVRLANWPDIVGMFLMPAYQSLYKSNTVLSYVVISNYGVVQVIRFKWNMLLTLTMVETGRKLRESSELNAWMNNKLHKYMDATRSIYDACSLLLHEVGRVGDAKAARRMWWEEIRQEILGYEGGGRCRTL